MRKNKAEEEQNALLFNPEEWGMTRKSENSELSQEQKISMAFSKIKDHPFLINEPSKAKEVAIFRIRLLNLK